MKINQINLTELRRMNGKEGLILQGCGGEVQEWVDGINTMLTDKGILLDEFTAFLIKKSPKIIDLFAYL